MTRLGLEQDELKSIMQDILEMDLNNDWEVRRRVAASKPLAFLECKFCLHTT
jgi:hypothetical protein